MFICVSLSKNNNAPPTPSHSACVDVCSPGGSMSYDCMVLAEQ